MVRSEELCSEIYFRRETRKSGKYGRAARTSPLEHPPPRGRVNRKRRRLGPEEAGHRARRASATRILPSRPDVGAVASVSLYECKLAIAAANPDFFFFFIFFFAANWGN